MSGLSFTDKTFLEAVLGMGEGYVLDFSNTSFAHFFDALGIDIYEEQFAEFGVSKANRLRTFWKIGSSKEIASSLIALAEYVVARKFAGGCETINEEQIAKLRDIAQRSTSYLSNGAAVVPSSVTTEASITQNVISIEIHDDIYGHIQQYLATADYFHAVEESYKVVREKLRELTGSEKANDVFNENAQNKKYYAALFAKGTPANPAEADFFRGVGYLHLGVQFLRNEKAHTLATFVEPNLAIHYISLASLAYDLITRNLSEDMIQQIEGLVREKRQSYRSATAFYRDFEEGKWMGGLTLPTYLSSSATRKALKTKWLGEADFTRSFDHSNVVLMQLELVADHLMGDDLDHLLTLPTKDSYGNDQAAGMQPFLNFMEKQDPNRLSEKVRLWLREQEA